MKGEAMAVPALVTAIFDGAAAEARLIELGLHAPTLLRVITFGEYARAESTENDPMGFDGLDAWRWRVRGLRDEYCPLGWTKPRHRGLELLLSPCGRHAVITKSGTASVGLKDGYPQLVGPVRETMQDAISMNEGLLDEGLLFEPSWMNSTSAPEEGGPFDTRILMVHRCGGIVRSELSLASRIEENPRGLLVLGWIERILLPAIDLSNDPAGRRKNEPTGPTEMFEIEPTLARKK